MEIINATEVMIYRQDNDIQVIIFNAGEEVKRLNISTRSMQRLEQNAITQGLKQSVLIDKPDVYMSVYY